jgi:hypothetical protein
VVCAGALSIGTSTCSAGSTTASAQLSQRLHWSSSKQFKMPSSWACGVLPTPSPISRMCADLCTDVQADVPASAASRPARAVAGHSADQLCLPPIKLTAYMAINARGQLLHTPLASPMLQGSRVGGRQQAQGMPPEAWDAETCSVHGTHMHAEASKAAGTFAEAAGGVPRTLPLQWESALNLNASVVVSSRQTTRMCTADVAHPRAITSLGQLPSAGMINKRPRAVDHADGNQAASTCHDSLHVSRPKLG